MNDTDRERLRHMLDASREAIAFTQGRTSDALQRDRVLLLALVKEIEIIGEAARGRQECLSHTEPEQQRLAAHLGAEDIARLLFRRGTS